MSHNNGNISSGSAAEAEAEPQAGSLSWRLSSHPMTLLCFLSFRICTRPFPATLPSLSLLRPYAQKLTQTLTLTPLVASILVYLFGMLFTENL